MNESNQSGSPQEAKPQTSGARRWIEVSLIVLLFFLYVGPLTPEVNEAHYLAKARHYWNPEWCPHDHFLNSGDAHAVFYWSFGWVTTITSFPVAAWLGRLICWLSLAVAWQRLTSKLTDLPWAGLLSAAVGVMAIAHLHMAGEWLIGGVEAKCFAYALAFWAVGDAVTGQWNRAWVLLGIASAFHVLVGGWMVVALLVGWALNPQQRPAFVSMLPGLVIGGLIALTSVVPLLLLNRGVDPGISTEASYSYVYERLSHHLVVHSFATSFKIRFAVAVLIWGLTAWHLRDRNSLRLFNYVVLGSVALVMIGVFIDQFCTFVLNDYALSSKLLRLYWYRIADVLVPLGLVMNGLLLFERYQDSKPMLAKAGMLVVCLVTVTLFALRAVDRFNTAVSPADRITRVSDPGGWQQVCRWIQNETPDDAIFLTPRLQSTFKWYAQRAEVVTTKDVPQDDKNLVEWRRRRGHIQSRSVHQKDTLSLAGLTEEDILEFTEEYGFQYVVVDRTLAERDGVQVDWSFPRVYPQQPTEPASYEVYRIAP